MYGVMNF